MKVLVLLAAGAALASAPAALAQTPDRNAGQTIQPERGQDAALQAMDQGQCSARAEQLTGVDPARPPAPRAADPLLGLGSMPVPGVAGALPDEGGAGVATSTQAGGDYGDLTRRTPPGPGQRAYPERLADWRGARADCLVRRGYAVREEQGPY